MGLVVTDTGRERIMFHYGAGTALVIDSVQVGTLIPAERYDAAVDAVALTDATPTTFGGAMPMISGASAQYNVQLSGADEVVASEIGLFEGTNLIMLWANQADDLFTKPANGNVLFAVGWSLAEGMISTVTVTVSALPVAVEADSRGLARNDVVMTPLQTSYAIDESAPGAATATEQGLTVLAEPSEVADALSGTDPTGNNEDNVVTLQGLYDQRANLYSPLATAAEIQATFGGTDPADAIEGKVLSLQAWFDSFKAYEDGNLPAAIPDDGTIEIVYET